MKWSCFKALYTFLSVLFFLNNVHAGAYTRIDKIDDQLALNAKWKFHTGDDKQWALSAFNDSAWSEISSHLDDEKADQFKGIGWFRMHLRVAPALFNKTFRLRVSQAGASEIYLNDKLVQTFGRVSATGDESPRQPIDETYFIQLGADTSQVIAVRYSAWKALQKQLDSPGFTMSLVNTNSINEEIHSQEGTIAVSIFLFTIFFSFSLFHLLLFLFYRKSKSNLYYSILAFIFAVFWSYPCIKAFTPNAIFHNYLNWASLFSFPLFFFLMVRLLYSIFQVRFTVMFWIISALTVITLVLLPIEVAAYGISIAALILLSSVESLRIAIKAVRQKKPGAWIIAAGFSVFTLVVLGILLVVLYMAFFVHNVNISASNDLTIIVVMAWAFSIPTSMSVYLASDFARTNKTLALQLVHVKQLGEQNLQKEKEKQQLIEQQNEMLERQVKEKTAEIQQQKDELEEKNKEITDSITYAKRIQQAILPPSEMLDEALGEYVVLYKPKDVVSGDFYWCHSLDDKVIYAVADCTGHGVPGAFMSMIGNSILNEVVIDRKVTEADKILNELRSTLISTLQKSAGHTTRDGMDIALCVWNKKDNTLQYAGANNSLYWISKGIANKGGLQETDKLRLFDEHLVEIVADKQPIGYQEGRMDIPFIKHTIQLRKGDMVYITSDGYTDQFGGEKNKKFTSKRFREMLASFSNLSTDEQRHILEDTIEQWKRYETQTDDICLIGIRVQ